MTTTPDSTPPPDPVPTRLPRAGLLAARAATGIVSAGIVLGVGELVSVAVAPNSSPFFAVGATTVDRAPEWAREFAIDTFSTNDKPALFAGIAIVIAVLAAVSGLAERQRRPVGSAMLLAAGAVGVYAALERPTATAAWAAPTVIGVAAGIVALRLMQRTLPAARADRARAGASDGEQARPQGAGERQGFSRRRFFAVSGGAAAVAAAAWAGGRALGAHLRDVIAERARFRIPFVTDRAAPIAPGTDLDVPGSTSFVTPNPRFYRIDTALQVPALSTEEWQLRIHGMVGRERTLDWDALTRRTPIERIITLTCVSNEVGGSLAGNATWIGYPIGDLIAELDVDPDADMLLSTSVDGFTVGTPVSALTDGRDAMLAVAMNGEPLPLEHGYPVRQVVPGLYGFVSATKWVVDWEFTRFDRAQAYWTRRGWGAEAPIKTASRIDVPSAFATVTPGRVRVAGTAWAQHRGIAAVEVRVGQSGPWNRATLAREYSVDTWRQWFWDWDVTAADAGSATLQVRATDKDGVVQTPERTPPIPGGATGWQSIVVTVQG
ncbi:molybdopterin-dependent oxidoreductase [Tomitella fengzijianii]|uniref:Molybdopterin-dependent oxidoreductase n=1 Tax=Tomitella fengzijianii TaxID=2597660 RepID=A0A516X5J0_9ACTN|nr:molybdopterin-dependent oxidoreductase [Tomitella fengzijianii]QDQ98310.1 molybdopterin-dependent oxidoreductase [Tomitella fengzijianii]